MDSSNIVYIVVFTIAVGFLGFIFLSIWRRAPSAVVNEPQEEPPVDNERRGLARLVRRARAADPGPNQGTDETEDNQSDSDEDEAQGSESSNGAMRKNRIGTKKKRKLEMKEARREYRQYEEEQRKKKKEEEQLADRERRKQERALEMQRAKEEEAERLEREKKEQEEYDEWKSLISVEEEGTEKDEVLDENSQMKLLADYIKREKIVMIEEMASHFALRPDELAALIEKMQAMKPPLIDGLFDKEQGKFLYIPLEQRRKLAEVIRQQGRINLQTLTWEAQKLIDLTPEQVNLPE